MPVPCHEVVRLCRHPRYARDQEEEARNASAWQEPEQLRQGSSPGEDASVLEDEMHPGVHGVVGEIGEVAALEPVAGRDAFDRVVAVPSPDPADPHAAERALPVVQQDRAR